MLPPESNPRFPATRENLGGHVDYLRKLIGQTLERYVAGSCAVRSARSYPESPVFDGRRLSTADPVGLELIKALFPRGRSLVACISSRIATVIQVGFVRSNEP